MVANQAAPPPPETAPVPPTPVPSTTPPPVVDQVQLAANRELWRSFSTTLIPVLVAVFLVLIFSIIAAFLIVAIANSGARGVAPILVVHLVQVGAGLAAGLACIFVGTAMCWFGIRSDIDLGLKGGGAEGLLKTAYIGVPVILGGIILLGGSMWKPVSFKSTTDEPGTESEKQSGKPAELKPAEMQQSGKPAESKGGSEAKENGALSAGRTVHTFIGAGSVAFTPEGKRALITTRDRHIVRLIEVASGKEIMQIDLPEPVVAMAVAPDGGSVITETEDSRLLLWDLSTGHLLKEYDSRLLGK